MKKLIGPFDWLDCLLVVGGATALRFVVNDNGRYLLACMFYGFMIGLGKVIISEIHED